MFSTPNPRGTVTQNWPDDWETPEAWELAHWSFDRVADWMQRKANRDATKLRKESARKSLLDSL